MKNVTEIEAIKGIRTRHQFQPQRKLARMIVRAVGTRNSSTYIHEFDQFDMDCVRRIGFGASFATTYNRIRRIDGSIK